MTEIAVTSSIRAGVATLTLARPEAKNSMSANMINALGDQLTAASADDAVRVVVLTNEGNTFCAGNDLKGTSTEEPRFTLVDIFKLMREGGKPVVGRIAGHCMGGGVGLAAACDISVIADDALVGFTEVRIGVAPAMISVVCLPKMRRGDALELFLSGERITAARAVEVGLLNKVAEAAELDAAVAEIVAKLVRGAPKAMAACRQLVYSVPGMDVDAAFAWTAKLSKELFQGEEAAAGITAFRNREDAPWVPEGDA